MAESLRSRVVEAGAEAIARTRFLAFDEAGLRSSYREEAEAALDAMLDGLTENADEWPCREDVWEEAEPPCPCISPLLAGLRASSCDGSATCGAGEHIHGCYRSKRDRSVEGGPMTTRYWAETECVHGEQRAHFHIDGVVAPNAYDPKAELCKGGSRRELTIDALAHAIRDFEGSTGLDDPAREFAITIVQAALGDTE